MAALLLGCTEEQSKAIGSQPKAAVDRAQGDVTKALERGADRSRESEEKKQQ